MDKILYIKQRVDSNNPNYKVNNNKVLFRRKNTTDLQYGDFNGAIYQITYIPSEDSFLIGGGFYNYKNDSKNGMIKLHSDGTVNTNFDVGIHGFDKFVHGFRIFPDKKIIVAGWFDKYNDQPYKSIVKLNADGTEDTSFQVGTGFDYVTYDVEILPDNESIFVGNFTTYQANSSTRIAKILPNGGFDTSFNVGTGFNGETYVVRAFSNGKLIVGGSYHEYNGTTSYHLIKLNADGTVYKTYNFSSSGAIHEIIINSDDSYYVGGDFSSYNGSGYTNIIKFNSDDTVDTSFFVDSSVFGSPSYEVDCMYIESSGKIILVGGFHNNIVRVDSSGVLDTSFNVGTGLNDTGFAIDGNNDNDIYLVGGAFTEYNGISRGYIVTLDGSGNDITQGGDPNSTISESLIMKNHTLLMSLNVVSKDATASRLIANYPITQISSNPLNISINTNDVVNNNGFYGEGYITMVKSDIDPDTIVDLSGSTEDIYSSNSWVKLPDNGSVSTNSLANGENYIIYVRDITPNDTDIHSASTGQTLTYYNT